jgi:hypothetical protein
MRRLIGFLGILLPLIVVFGSLIQHEALLDSISGYYYTNMRDFFVGLLSGVGLFLISYKGYEMIDDFITKFSGVCALAMILFPTAMYSEKIVRVGILQIDNNVSELIHLIFSAMFFLALSYNSIFLFTRRHPGVMGKEKRRRNVIYRICGIIMLFSIVCISIYTYGFKGTWISKTYPVLILESIGLFAFGISWIVKGNTLIKDKR